MRKTVTVTVSLVILILIAAVCQVLRPLPALRVKPMVRTDYRVPGTLNIQWPAQGSAAIEVAGVGICS